MNTLAAIARLQDALEACRSTDALDRGTEAAFVFEVSDSEYAAVEGCETVDVDPVDGSTSRSKLIFDAEEFFALSITATPRTPSAG